MSSIDRDRNDVGRAENQRPRDRAGRPLAYETTDTELAEDHDYDTVDEALLLGAALWDQERFFEAHECLEDVWHHAPEDDREFWKGVIQVAVGCVHHQRDNAAGARALWGRAADRLSDYPDVHHGIDVEQLIIFCVGASEAVRLAGGCVEVGYPEMPRMDGGPWFDEGRVTPLTRRPSWQFAADAAAARTARSEA